MDSVNTSVANDTAVGGLCEGQESCEHMIIYLSVLMTLNMLAIMVCNRNYILGTFRQLLSCLVVPGQGRLAREVHVNGSHSRPPSTENIVIYAQTSKTATMNSEQGKAEAEKVMMAQSSKVAVASTMYNKERVEMINEENARMLVLKNRPLPPIPEQMEENEGRVMETVEKKLEGKMKKVSTGSTVTYVEIDVGQVYCAGLDNDGFITGPEDEDNQAAIDVELSI